MIEIKQLAKSYQTPDGPVMALQDINLQVNSAEIFGIIGKSGAGKSSLIRCINLLERPCSGSITVAGEELTTLSASQLRQARQHIAMIFQHFNLLAQCNVYANVAFPLRLKGYDESKIKSIITPLLELTGLLDKQKFYPSQLSGGQKQRVAIARALACQPKVLLCDEATSALDPDTTRAILQLLRKINQEFSLTIVLITHEMEVIKQLCDRVALIEGGKIVKQSSVVDFFARPHPEPDMAFLQAYLRHDLPDIVQRRLLTKASSDARPVVRIYFQGEVTAQPLIAQLIQQQNVHVNILQAQVEHIHGEIIGIMVVELIYQAAPNDAGRLQQSLDFLRQHGLTVEVIGYVPRDVVGFS